jgi:cob(I)alamin adenosyltransferase
LPSVFIVPGSDPVSAGIDHARAVVRRAERHAVAAAESGSEVSSVVVCYLNRLSDLLFVLARDAATRQEPTSRG